MISPNGPIPAGIRVLVVEDEYLLADDLKCTLEEAGISVVGPAGTPSAAHELVDAEQFDLALLDINLHGTCIYPLAHRLLERDIPFVFVTGYEHNAIPFELRDIEYLEKPVSPARLLSAVSKVVQKPARSGRRNKPLL